MSKKVIQTVPKGNVLSNHFFLGHVWKGNFTNGMASLKKVPYPQKRWQKWFSGQAQRKRCANTTWLKKNNFCPSMPANSRRSPLRSITSAKKNRAMWLYSLSWCLNPTKWPCKRSWSFTTTCFSRRTLWCIYPNFLNELTK